MGAFNILIIHRAACPFCGNEQPWRLQFKYAKCRLYEYHVGDAIAWADNDSDNGRNTGRQVVIEGINEMPCTMCEEEEVYAKILVEHNVLTAVQMVAEPLPSEENYLS